MMHVWLREWKKVFTSMFPQIQQLIAATAVLALAIAAQRLRRRQRLRRIKGEAVLVTGASSGIGREIALQCAARGCDLVLAGRNVAALAEVADLCKARGSPKCRTVKADITVASEVESLFATVRAHEQRLDVLVLNAGQGAITPFDGSAASMAICREMMEVNYFANARLLQLALPLLSASRGRVLVVSSVAGVLPSALRAAYTASKHAVQGFINALRQEFPAVTFTLSCPGFVQTPFHDRVLSVTGSAPERSAHHKRAMTAAECAALSLDAAEHGDYELVMTWVAWFGYVLRPWLPRLVDSIARRKALGSLKDGASPKSE